MILFDCRSRTIYIKTDKSKVNIFMKVIRLFISTMGDKK